MRFRSIVSYSLDKLGLLIKGRPIKPVRTVPINIIMKTIIACQKGDIYFYFPENFSAIASEI